MDLLLIFLVSSSVTMITTPPFFNELFAEEFNDDREYCSDYNGLWNKDKEKCEFKDKDNKEAYEYSICKDPKEAEHYPQVC
jgi:hypothetical protein